MNDEANKSVVRELYEGGAALRTAAAATAIKPSEALDIVDFISATHAKSYGTWKMVPQTEPATDAAVQARDLILGATRGSGLVNVAALNAANPGADVRVLPNDEHSALVDALDATAITLAADNVFANGVPKGFKPLERWAVAAAKSARAGHLGVSLAGKVDDADAAKNDAIASARLDAVVKRPTKANTDAVVELSRLKNTMTRELDGFLDTRTGAIVLVEKHVPLAPAIVDRIDPVANNARLQELVRQRVPSPVHDQAIAELARKIPGDLLTLVDRAKLERIDILRSTFMFSGEAGMAAGLGSYIVGSALGVGASVALSSAGVGDHWVLGSTLVLELGVTLALGLMPTTLNPVADFVARFRESRGNTGGHVVFGDSILEIAPYGVPRADETEGTLGHEIFHVLDFCMARHGALSSEPEFVALYENSLAAREQGDIAYPSTYGRSDRQEFFAEGACAFLDIARPYSTSRMKRADLKAHNPELYAYFEHLFAVRLPAAVANNDIQPFKLAYLADTSFEAAQAKAPQERTDSDWSVIIGRSLQRAELERDPSALVEAEEAIKAAGTDSKKFFFSPVKRAQQRRAAAIIANATERLTSIHKEFAAGTAP